MHKSLLVVIKWCWPFNDWIWSIKQLLHCSSPRLIAFFFSCDDVTYFVQMHHDLQRKTIVFPHPPAISMPLHPSQHGNLVVSRGSGPHLAPSTVRPISELQERRRGPELNRFRQSRPAHDGCRGHVPTQTRTRLRVDSGVDANGMVLD